MDRPQTGRPLTARIAGLGAMAQAAAGMTSEQEQLVRSCQGLVRSIAWKIHRQVPRHLVDLDDLIGYGQIGLCEAAGGYDSSRGTQFTTFAYYRIRGAILDGLSKMSWFRKADFHGGRYEQLAAEVIEGTSDAEAGTAPEDDYRELKNASAALAVTYLFCQLGSGDEGGPVESTFAGDECDPSEEAGMQDVGRRLHELVDELPEREKTLVRGVYFEGLSIKECGERLGLSKSWASRLHAQTLTSLARELGESPMVSELCS